MSAQKKRNFKIEAFKHRVELDPNYAERTWRVLEHAIHEIYNHNASGLSFEELYRNAYNMVLHKYGEKLYSGLVNTMTGHLKEIARSIEAAQGGEVINRGLMRNITKMLMDLGSSVYQEDFEKPFLGVSASFYSVESQQLIECCDCGEYLRKAERRLNEEIERVSHYLDVKSEVKITSVVEGELIANHMQRLVHMENSGLVSMLVDDKYEDLSRMYNLFRRVPDGLSTIKDVMTSHLRETGKQLVSDPEKLKDPVDFVQHLLDEKDKYDKIISKAFNNDKTFQNALNSSFEYFINLNNRSPEFISLYVDDKLRKGLKGVSEEDVEVVLDKVMMLFRYLQEKDVFEKYYKQHLAKRLLSGKSPSAPCNLPAEILVICEKFRSYYLGTHTGRRLTWQTNMGTADIKATFGKGQKHELNVSTYQMCILMLYNSTDQLTYREIEQATEIPPSDLKRCLQSLACVKGKNVLRKEPMSKDIAEDDAFYFNDKFMSKFFKVKIGTVAAQKESEPEKQETRQRVEEDRKPQIEAAIVRIMKSRRVLDHNTIVTEVTSQLQSRFLPNPVIIKKRIESLIEREFLERDKADRKLYRYLA
ncbi:hypothetical protein C4D60_Mb08t17290 [Musa balbisiana]|uniref:Cullin family profile domain-containing protein n=1 Tax=Musa balbisiana TaxID=52838 RepID=A0A4S8K4H7_MUSBA|nr:hypothetical protein C4D60_Mb08t17290 [Musa balbisiana]